MGGEYLRNQQFRYLQGALLEVRDLKKYFPVKNGLLGKTEQLKAVDKVSFTLRAGETLGLVGESGCGKSTLGNTIIRLLRPSGGEIRFKGRDLAALSEREMAEYRPNIQMIFQDPFSSLNPRMKVFEIIAEPLRTHGLASGKALQKRVLEMMDVVGLDPSYQSRYPHEFSGGQRQRIGIARALALKPELVICDEPVSALDVSIQAQILNLLYDLQKEFNLTFIFIAHGLPTVKHISSQVAVMYLGKIVEMAPKELLFSRPLHPYTEGLLDAIPIPDPELRAKREKEWIVEGDIPNALHPPEGCHFNPRCPYAEEVCRHKEPVFAEIQPGHFTACHRSPEDSK
jgi:peptide/nickel transport system ATP-binding protein